MRASLTIPDSNGIDRTCALVVGVIGRPGEQRTRITRALSVGGLGDPVQADSLEQCVEGGPARSPDVIVLELSDANGSALEVVAGARTAFPRLPLVAVWQCSLAGEQHPALRLGVDGMVIADELERTLVPTLRAVAAGLICVPRALRRELKRENLSGREKQILGMVVTGSTNAEIAARLFLAESTVKSHLSSAYEKLGVRSRRDAAALILDPAIGLDRGILAISAA